MSRHSTADLVYHFYATSKFGTKPDELFIPVIGADRLTGQVFELRLGIEATR